ncbi:hypothetical protein HDE76_002618 [Rhodanobacter sp. ANJX3]|uniref:EcsC family protein n=1 Tax=unclassified Rhodanobacter TaxID=2621553 RepID=UPI001836F587|nr:MULTISPECIES: EcsC family protein [unclassified Rhodanobacter]MBB5359389.1 hypothetical protein [Rhodanobacter sp. ANJX3]NYE29858.1 hypothetical protein [Rhodanobacter sp. K2T2]
MSKTSKNVPAVIEPVEHNKVTQAILDFVSKVPASKIDSSANPDAEAHRIANAAARRAALTAGSLALPPGPLGWLTILPELTLIWKIQAQMVSDIAAAYGHHASLGREQMLWCLFRHTAAQAFRDLVVQMGDRLVFRRMSHGIAQRVAKQVGIKLTQRTVGEGISRWLPVVGAIGVGAYAYYDTGHVASTAIALFSGNMEMMDDADDAVAASGAAAATAAVLKPKPKTVSAAKTAVKKAVKKVAKKAANKALASTARKIAKKADSVSKAASKRAAAKPRKPKSE